MGMFSSFSLFITFILTFLLCNMVVHVSCKIYNIRVFVVSANFGFYVHDGFDAIRVVFP